MRYSGAPLFLVGQDPAWGFAAPLRPGKTPCHTISKKTGKEKGFTLIQTVILAELDGLHSPMLTGQVPRRNLIPNNPMTLILSMWTRVVSLADELGLYLGPASHPWGDKFNKKWGIRDRKFYTPENATKLNGLFPWVQDMGIGTLSSGILGGDRIQKMGHQKEIIEGNGHRYREMGSDRLMSLPPHVGVTWPPDIFWRCPAGWT